MTIILPIFVLGLSLHSVILPVHHPCFGHLYMICWPTMCWPAGLRGSSASLRGGLGASVKFEGRRIGDASSSLLDDSAESSSEDISILLSWMVVM